MHNNFSAKFAFTLAEVLITLGIIGIVAEMTIPTLMNNVQNKTYAVQLKKAVSVLNSATEMIKMDNGGSMIGIWPNNGTIHSMNDNQFGTLYSKYIKTIKICNTDPTYGTCWHKDLTWKDASGNPYTNCAGCSAFYTVDGMWVESGGAQYYNCEGSGTGGSPSGICIGIYIDVNGAKQPNKIGTDIHPLFITQNGVFSDSTGPTYDMLMK